MKVRTSLIVILSVFVLLSCRTIDETTKTPLVGIAWRNDTSSPSFNRIKEYLESGGAEVIVLEKATTSDLEYYSDGTIKDDYLQYDFSLTEEASQVVKTTENIVSPESLDRVDLVVFTGGEDLSPYLYGDSFLSDDPIYNPDRDVSDYLTLRLAMDKGIPVFGICRGMQLMAVYGESSLIIDLPCYFEIEEEKYRHRSVDGGYTFHSLSVAENSLLSGIDLDNVASSHHQALDTASGGEYSTIATDGLIVEAIEIPSSSFAFGIQFHPEYYVDYKESEEWKSSLEILRRVLSQI